MMPDTSRAITVLAGRRVMGVVLIALVTSGLCLTGCSVVRAVSKVAHDVEGNKATIDAFTNKMSSNSATPFEAVYVTTGSSPATIVYAVQPPKGLAFKDTPSGTTNTTGSEINSFDVVVNGSGNSPAPRPLREARAPGNARSSPAPTPRPRTRSSTSIRPLTGSRSSRTSRWRPHSPATR